MKRNLLLRFTRPLLALTGALLALAGPGLGAAQPRVVRFGYQPGHAQIVLARDLGWIDREFAKDGITFKYEKFASGPPIIEAFVGGRLDFGQVGDQPAIQAKANHMDFKAIAIYAASERGYGLLVRKDSGARSLRELKGKKVGVTLGSVGHQLLYLYLKAEGLKRGDIQQVNLSPGDLVAALAAGHIDAAITWEPYLSLALAGGTTRLVKDATGVKNVVNPVIARSDFLQAHPDVATRLLRLFDQANRWLLANPDKGAELIARDSGFRIETLRPLITKNDFDLRLTPAAIRSMEDTAAFLKENGVIRTEVKVRDLVDTRFLVAAGIQKK